MFYLLKVVDVLMTFTVKWWLGLMFWAVYMYSILVVITKLTFIELVMVQIARIIGSSTPVQARALPR